jgi:hypothetical protein
MDFNSHIFFVAIGSCIALYVVCYLIPWVIAGIASMPIFGHVAHGLLLFMNRLGGWLVKAGMALLVLTMLTRERKRKHGHH